MRLKGLRTIFITLVVFKFQSQLLINRIIQTKLPFL